MSLAAYMWACSLSIGACSGPAYRVLLKYADCADELGRGVWRSDLKLAEELETSVSTVRRGRHELITKGLISLGDQRYVQHIRADRRPTVYDLETPAKKLDDAMRARAAPECQHRPHYEVVVPGCDCSGCWGETSTCTHESTDLDPTRTGSQI